MNDSLSFAETEETQNIIDFITLLCYNHLCSLVIDYIRSLIIGIGFQQSQWLLSKTSSKNSLVLSVFALAGVKSALRFSQA
jgi:hypothetical protein